MNRPQEHSLGTPLPPRDPHAITVSLPTWKSNLDFAEREPSILDRMLTGYPRFVIHRKVAELAEIFLRKSSAGAHNEDCLLFSTAYYANECEAFLTSQTLDLSPPPRAWKAQFSIVPETDSTAPTFVLHAVFFPSSIFKLAKLFWQHTGFGISSRMAQRGLELLAEPGTIWTSSKVHEGSVGLGDTEDSMQTSVPSSNGSCPEGIEMGRKSDAAMLAKRTLRSRIAGFLQRDSSLIEPNQSGIPQVCDDDVFLYPMGMTAAWNVHRLAMSMHPTAKSVCFGFPYMDTLKVLQKWGPGCHFFGHDPVLDMERLEELLSSSPDTPPISALFCELPSNPRLQSPRLDRLRALADRYDFLIVLDDAIGTFVNVDVLPYVDIVVTSLTKFFSGYANAAGGSLVLNPRMRHYSPLKAAQNTLFADTYFDEDAIVMERNSRDFASRMRTINTNTDIVCEFLRSRSLLASPNDENLVIKEIFYPKWITRQEYDLCRVKHYADGEPVNDNFGGLFTLTFTSDLASQTFFDALSCAKGPSFGTNFTLACPYTILAHYGEREWAEEYGVEQGLVRISIGLEDKAELLAAFDFALRKAECAIRENRA